MSITGLRKLDNTCAFYSVVGDTIRLNIKLTPGAKKEGFGGVICDADGTVWLKASVRAVPEDGKANAALIKMISKIVGIPRSQITHASGHTNRMKVFELPFDQGIADTLAAIG